MAAADWKEASERVDKIAGDLPTYYGSGNPIAHPCVVYRPMDAWSGEGQGYWVHVYPEGQGYMKPVQVYSVRIA